jgi:hypothetical protein
MKGKEERSNREMDKEGRGGKGETDSRGREMVRRKGTVRRGHRRQREYNTEGYEE